MSSHVTMTQIRAAVAIFTAFEMSQEAPEQTATLGQAAADALRDLYANGPEVAAGAFCALMRPLLQHAARGTEPARRARVWQDVVRTVERSGIPTA